MKMTILLHDGYTALDIVGGYEVLANLPGLDVEFAAHTLGWVWADTRRLALPAWRQFAELAHTDILYLPGGPGVDAGLKDEALIAAVRRLHASSAWTVAVCNGVEWLGGAGALEGRTVTTNWFARDRVAAYGARVSTQRVERDGKLITGAGVSASIEAGLHLAGLISGDAMASALQLGIEYYPQMRYAQGSADMAPPAAQALVRRFEAEGSARLRACSVPSEARQALEPFGKRSA